MQRRLYQERLEMTKNKDIDIEIYNKEQQWWVNIKENCVATIQQFKNSIKLQKAIQEMAEQKIKELA